MTSDMDIIWHGHSCFELECGSERIIIDPYKDGSVWGLPPLHLYAEAVYCSHQHSDHNYIEAVTLTKSYIPEYSALSYFAVTHFDTFHDNAGGKKRGANRVHIFEGEGRRVAHLGDLGCMPDGEQLEMLKNLDCMLLPIGGFFTINAKTAKALVELTKPRTIVPMHYSGKGFGFPVLAKVTEFTKLFDHVTTLDTNYLELNAETPSGVIVLKCPTRP
ncbi:MAG: MBL fold metallo-hydrolase [Firmicutes bacterium]|nr:MBL fold metallo-hydrolase [Bacillota bacterium]